MPFCNAITVQLNAAGFVTIDANDVGGTSGDDCGIQSMTVIPSLFTCEDIATNPNIATLIVTDVNGNIATCDAEVTVVDDIDPTALCQDITIELDANGVASLTALDIDDGSFDNCDVASLDISDSLFGCANVGDNTVVLTVTDGAGQTSTCMANVHVQDPVAPQANCVGMDIFLDASGNASIVPADVDDPLVPSNDACGIASLSVFPDEFECKDVGANLFVQLTVTDNNGNTSVCVAPVNVHDLIPPEAICHPSVSVILNAQGQGFLTPQEVDNGSNDACNILAPQIDQTFFDCDDVDEMNVVTLTITDLNMNISTCQTVVHVIDNIEPEMVCDDVTVELDEFGFAYIDIDDIDGGSNDACGIASMSLDQTVFECSDAVPLPGENTVILHATDSHGNTNTCSATVTVIDDIDPVAACKDVTVELLPDGTYSLQPGEVDNGSFDICTVDLTVAPNAFDCDDVTGTHTVTLTATDPSGNSDNCTAEVTVMDLVPVDAQCQDIMIALDASGNVTITEAQIDNGSTDACGIASSMLDVTEFDCNDVGDNTVTLTFTDVNGNISSCEATVTVEDNEDPIALCQDITVQLDANGMVSITSAQIDNGSNDACGIASLSVSPSDFNCDNVGQNPVVLTVTDNNDNVSTCNALVTVEDNVDPQANCQNILVELDIDGEAMITPADIDSDLDPSNDACGIASLTLDETAFDCDDVGDNTVVLTVTDVNGNFATCEATVTVEDNVDPIAICQDVVVQLDADGNGSITPADVDNDLTPSNDACGIASLALDDDTFVCADVGMNTVVLTVTDVNGNFATCEATITVEDNVPPDAECQNITVQLDANGQASITGMDVDNGSDDACGVASLSVLPNTFTCADVGNNAVVLTVTDVHGNQSICNATVTVEDNVPPVALCQDLVIELDANGNASITPAQVDDGSHDACLVRDLILDKSTFGCGDVGHNTVTLTVVDFNDNESTCTADIEVQDNIAPEALCQPVIVDLDDMGNGTVTPEQVDNGSNDACGIQSLALDDTSFDCNDVDQPITVTLTVTDNHGNISECDAPVTVRDLVAPDAQCMDIVVQLDANGDASITTADINNGSSDACGIAHLELDVTGFDCTNVGANSVTLTVTDVNGNVSDCGATVTVEDNVPPTALCQPLTISLDASGSASITPAQVDNGSNDACGIFDMSLDVDDFGCDDVGDNTVTLTVTDNNGNQSQCMATITVEDDIDPTAVCAAHTVELDADGNGTLSGSDIDGGSFDNCAIVSLTPSVASFSCGDVSLSPVDVTLTVLDEHGNSSTCIAQVTVVDLVAPEALCQNFSVDLDPVTGQATISENDIDAGSNDACGIASISLDETSFDCNDVGSVAVTLTVIDNNGNVSSCGATVAVNDVTAPDAQCQDFTVSLAANGTVEIDADDINNGSSDACGISHISLDQDDFDCNDVGDNTVTLTVVDNNQNQNTCTATVTVVDDTHPVAECQDIVLELDANGNGSITPEQINDESEDACGIASLELDNSDFDCAYVGDNTVTLTVTDVNGNESICVATVTVEDNVAPSAVCNDVDLILNPDEGTITPMDVDAGTMDACGIMTLSVSPSDFDCGDVGDNTVTLTATDINGNVSTCQATVTVIDTEPPTAACQDIVIHLGNDDDDDDDDEYEVTISPGDIGILPPGLPDFYDSGQSLGHYKTRGVDLGDVDGDGDLDAFTANYYHGNKVWLNDGAANFTHGGQYLGNKKSTGVRLEDLNGDGHLDAFVVNYRQGNRVYTNDGTGNFTDSGQSLNNKKSYAVDLGDVDGDGDYDAFVGNRGGNRVYLNNGSGSFTDSGQSLGSKNTKAVRLEDLDGDGDLDAFCANDGSGNRVWINDGNGNFSDSGQSLSYKRSYAVDLADIDGDGDIDAYVGNYNQGNRVWLNDGNANFTDSGLSYGHNNSKGVALANLNTDDRPELFEVSYYEPGYVWLNDGSGEYTDSGQRLGHYKSKAVALGDLDGDGDTDAFVGNYQQGNRVWLNDVIVGITDNCGITSLHLSQTSFTCADIGVVQVILTVTDVSGNTSTCISNVTVLSSDSDDDDDDFSGDGDDDDDGPGCGIVDCCNYGDGDEPSALTFVYTGSDCGATYHFQDEGKVSCNDYGTLPATVYIEATKFKSSGTLYFSGTVDLNEQWTATDDNGDFGGTLFIKVYDTPGGTLLQKVSFHTSCSQPLVVGNQFGAHNLVGIEFGNDASCGVVSQAQGIWTRSFKPGIEAKVSPNPFAGEMLLEIFSGVEMGHLRVRIYNSQGVTYELLEIEEASQFEEFVIDGNKLPDGVYYIHIQTDTEIKQINVVKTRT